MHVKHIGICPVPDFFGYTSYVTTGTVTDVIIPLKPVAVYIPAVIINVESGSYECKLFADAADIMRVDISNFGSQVNTFSLMYPTSFPQEL